MYLLQQLLTKTAELFPEREAVRFKDQALTYRELDEKSNQLAQLLVRLGVRPGDRVGILLGKSPEGVVALFGILKAGGIYVPLDPGSPGSRLATIVRQCGIGIAVASADHLERLLSEAGEGVPLSNAVTVGAAGNVLGVGCTAWSALEHEKRAPLPQNRSGASPAYILHTSGSTGLPKGVVISHLNALSFVEMAADFFGITADDRLANHAPLHFDLSIFDIFCAVKRGAALVLVPESLSAFPVRLAEFLQRERITVWNSVASVLTKLADQGALARLSVPQMRLVHFSGDLMPVKYLRVLKRFMPAAAFYNIYGQTEANSSLCFRVPDELPQDAWKIPIGIAFPNFEVFALDEAGEVVTEPGREGELHVLAATVALGYWNDPARTAAQFAPDPRSPAGHARVYRTGDIARLDVDGNFVFTGRRDHMVKSKGFRVELDEIEVVLSSHPGITQAAVIAIPDELTGSRIVAYVSCAEGAVPESAELLGLCGAHLPKYMIPERIICRPTLPVTSNSKIDRKALEREFTP